MSNVTPIKPAREKAQRPTPDEITTTTIAAKEIVRAVRIACESGDCDEGEDFGYALEHVESMLGEVAAWAQGLADDRIREGG